MKLISVNIERFRSIENANNFLLKDYTVLIGKNNEGKSNIISAINLAFNYYVLICRYETEKIISRQRRFGYIFENDYPVKLQNKNDEFIEKHPTKIDLSFSFSDKEKDDFQKETKLTYTSEICAQIEFYKNGKYLFKIKRRKGDAKQAKTVIKFIIERMAVTFIPTIRTSEQSLEVIQRIVNDNLSTLRNDEEYKKAYELILAKEKERLAEISENLKPTLSSFLPNIKDVKIEYDAYISRGFYRNNVDLVIDDGVLTSIDSKGDGIKSLVQMGLLKETSKNNDGLIIIEEPEAHLHSGAIHELNKVLRDISKNQQVLIKTNNSIFANGFDYNANIIVSEGECKSVTSLNELRNVLGIEVSESLFVSDCVILVEGNSDKVALSYLLSCISLQFKKLVGQNKIMFYETKGASKSKTIMTLMNQLLIKYYCIWDNDDAGKTAYDDAKQSNLVHNSNYSFIDRLNRNEAELEDMYNADYIKGIIADKYEVNIDLSSNNKRKWSYRIKKQLERNGKVFNSKDEEELKNELANRLKDYELNKVLNPGYKVYLDNLINNILSYFGLNNDNKNK